MPPPRDRLPTEPWPRPAPPAQTPALWTAIARPPRRRLRRRHLAAIGGPPASAVPPRAGWRASLQGCPAAPPRPAASSLGVRRERREPGIYPAGGLVRGRAAPRGRRGPVPDQ